MPSIGAIVTTERVARDRARARQMVEYATALQRGDDRDSDIAMSIAVEPIEHRQFRVLLLTSADQIGIQLSIRLPGRTTRALEHRSDNSAEVADPSP